MSESTTPPPKHGSGAMIGAVILMLLAMGGLLYWKFTSKDETPTASLPVPSATSAPTLEEAPPPPPPIEPDAGKAPEPNKKKVVASGGGGCGGACSGEVPAQLRSALASAANSARGCYERALRQNAMLQGKMLVNVKVGTHGNSCGANLVSDSLGDPSVATCVLQKFRGGQFPAPKGGCAEVNVPISFIPKTAK